MLMATLSLLFTAVLSTFGTGLIINAILENRAAQTTSFDLFIGSGRTEADFEEYLTFIHENIPLKEEWQYEIYLGEDARVLDYVTEHTEYYRYYPRDVLMKQSDYAKLRRMLGYPEAELRPGEYVIHCMSYLKNLLTEYRPVLAAGEETLTFGGFYTEYFNQYLWDGNGLGYLLVVPDEAVRELTVSHSIYAAMTEEEVGKEQCEELDHIRDRRAEESDVYDTLYIESRIKEETAASSALFVFPLYYLALMLTMTAATILTIQQLAETGRFQHQFGLLEKLGMDRREMAGTLRKQLALYYTLPALPSVIISVPFILNLGKSAEPGLMVGHSHPLAVVGAALGLFLLIYLIYIVMAYVSLRRSVLRD